MTKRNAVTFLIILNVIGLGTADFGYGAKDEAWREIKGKNFVIYYESRTDETLGQTLLRRAEEYYQKIGADIGYARTNKFWTWEERVKIFLFVDRESFLKTTGQPAWSTGYADRDSQVFNSKAIVTFTQEQEFLDGLLPHEISHLILHDFIPQSPGGEQIPIWFDEGVAQLQEKSKREMAKGMMKNLVQKKLYIPLKQLTILDIRRVQEPRIAEIFYAQSLSLVDYLITKYGMDAFGRLCRGLRDNKSFEQAMASATSGAIKNFNELEIKWLSSFNY